MNVFIYLIKFIASMCVIAIHTRFPGSFGICIDALARFAVPFFFAVSGRFLVPYSLQSTDLIRRRVLRALKKLLVTTAVVWLVYCLYSLIFHLLDKVTLAEWFKSKFNASEARWFLLFNSGKFIYDGSYTFDHIWYLFALIYVYVLIYIFAPVLRKWCRPLTVTLLAFLFLGELLQTFYPIRPLGISISTWYVVRNWLFVGMPFVLMGIWFSDYIGTLRQSLTDSQYDIKAKSFLLPGTLSLVFGMLFSAVEFAFLGKREVCFGSLMMVIGLLLLSEAGLSGGRFLWKIGREGSADIYFYHVLLISIVDSLVRGGIIPEIPMWFKPLLIMLLSIVFIWFIPRRICGLRKKQQ